jgi:predicted MFS family arabinose efflux permease
MNRNEMTAGFEPTPNMGLPPERRWQGRAAYVLVLFMLIGAFNHADRQVLAILLVPIKADIHATDTQMGLLTGFAFATFYCIAAIPIARYADRGNRRNIVAAAVGLWSAATLACGFMTNFVQMLIGRIGVASGEAAAQPALFSMISDMFPSSKRGRAISIYYVGVSIGIFVGLWLAGMIATWSSWRMAFICFGFPGVALAILIRLTVSEPDRTGIAADSSGDTVWGDIRYLFAQRTVILTILGSVAMATAVYSGFAWSPTFFIRVHHLTLAQAGLYIGMATGLGTGIGTFLSGYIADRLSHGKIGSYTRMPLVGAAFAAPVFLAFLFAPTLPLALGMFFLYTILVAFVTAPNYTVVLGLVRTRSRAFTSAAMAFMHHIIGSGLGPLLIGFLNDRLAPGYGDYAIRYSFFVVLGAVLLSCVFYELARRSIDSNATAP